MPFRRTYGLPPSRYPTLYSVTLAPEALLRSCWGCRPSIGVSQEDLTGEPTAPYPMSWNRFPKDDIHWPATYLWYNGPRPRASHSGCGWCMSLPFDPLSCTVESLRGTSHTSAKSLWLSIDSGRYPMRPAGIRWANRFPARLKNGVRAAGSPSGRQWANWNPIGALGLWPALQPARGWSARPPLLPARHTCTMERQWVPTTMTATGYHPQSFWWGDDCRFHENSLCRLLA